MVTCAKGKPKTFTVAQQVRLQSIYETIVLVSTQTEGLIEVNPYPSVAENHVFITAKHVMDVYLARPFDVTIANFGMIDVHLPRQETLEKSQMRLKKSFAPKANASRTSLVQKRLNVTASLMLYTANPDATVWTELRTRSGEG